MDKKIKISFIPPYKAKRPTGGMKILYEYANRLAKQGHSVHIYYPLQTKYIKYRFPFVIRWILAQIEGFRTFQWFKFEPSVTMSYVSSVSDKNIADADIVIATWWSTALEMGKLSPSKGKKINLIQGFENWEGHEDLLYTSYQIPDTINVVVAPYLKEIVDKHSENKIYIIENAVNQDIYRVINDIDARNPFSVSMNYSTQEIKGSKYGIEALEKVKKQIPELTVDLFSIFPRPDDIPEWMNFYQTPEHLEDVYNNSAIFITNSLTEGFALVPIEALFCGCALICTNIEGHREYGIEGETALTVEPKNVDEMVDRIMQLIQNNEERITLAKRGNNLVQKFSWEVAMTKIEQVISEALNN